MAKSSFFYHTFCNLIFAVADVPIGGQPVLISSGGGDSTSDLAWDGRRANEKEAYQRRCMKAALALIMRSNKSRGRSR